MFVEFELADSATQAVEDSGRANVLGRKLTMNFKMTKKANSNNAGNALEDKDCWFCFENPNVTVFLSLNYLDRETHDMRGERAVLHSHA